MIRATYGDLLPSLARIAGASGMNLSDPRVLYYTNLAIQELMDEEDWPSLVCRMRFKVTSCNINVPSEFDRILMLNINGVPQPMQSPWFEFVGEGPGYLNSAFPTDVVTNQVDQGLLGRLEGVLDREEAATFEDIPSDGTTYYPAIYAGDISDSGVIVILQGYDTNGNWIRSNDPINGWQDGVSLTLNGLPNPYAISTQAFSAITGIQKPVTNSYVSLYCSNGSSNVFLCQYAPYDTKPYYRRYKIPNLSKGQTYCIEARLRRRYAPIVKNNDYLLITNLPALTTMVQAVFYREAENLQSYAAYKQLAIEIMKKEMTSYIGKQRQKPLITMNEGMGVRRDGILIL